MRVGKAAVLVERTAELAAGSMHTGCRLVLAWLVQLLIVLGCTALRLLLDKVDPSSAGQPLGEAWHVRLGSC